MSFLSVESELQASGSSLDRPESALPPRRFVPPPLGILLSEWTLCNIGHYCLLATLSLYLLVTLHLAAPTAALLLLFSSLAFRLARFFVAPLIDQLSPRIALLLSTSLGCLGYIGLIFVSHPLLLLALFCVIGIGYGSNALLIKALAASGVGASRLLRYASINTGLNIGAAIGPIVGNTLFLHWNPHLLFLFPACMFALAGFICLLFQGEEKHEAVQSHWIKSLHSALQYSIVRQNMLFVFAGFFLYSQIFSTLPLVTRLLFHAPDLLSSYFALNALLIVLVQIPATRLMISIGLSPRLLLRVSLLMYTAGFILIWLLPYWQIAFPAVVLWTGGEMLLFPALDTMMAAEIPASLRITCFSLSAVAVAFGEGFGSLLGVWVVGVLSPLGQIRHLYVFFAVFAAVTLAAALLIIRRPRVQGNVEKAQH